MNILYFGMLLKLIDKPPVLYYNLSNLRIIYKLIMSRYVLGKHSKSRDERLKTIYNEKHFLFEYRRLLVEGHSFNEV